MKKKLVSCICLLLAAALIGCSSPGPAGGPDTAPTISPEAAKGRYMEEEMALPPGIIQMIGLRELQGGALMAIGSNAEFEWELLRSEDGGKTWAQVTYPWLEEARELPLAGMALDEAGGLYLLVDESSGDPDAPSQSTGGTGAPDAGAAPAEAPPATPAEGEGEDTPAPADEAGSAEGAEPEEPEGFFFGAEMPMNYRLLHGNAEGYEELEAPGTYMRAMIPVGEKLLLLSYSGVTLVDGKTGAEIRKIDFGMMYPSEGGIAANGDTLAIAGPGSISLYSLDTGALTAEIKLSTGNAADSTMSFGSGASDVTISIPEDGSAIYYASGEGIFRMLLDGSMVEQVVDGELTSLGMPSFQMQSLTAFADNSFLVMTLDESGSGLFRYAYDAEAPRVPGTELRVFSLYDNKTVRQAIGQFQRQNPDVRVTLHVGVSDGVTESDALRNLSTELLAKKGPDILVLDGMPVDSYIGKGVLLDLKELLSADIAAGKYLDNVLTTYERDGALYAVPARFKLPYMVGENTADIDSLEALAQWYAGQSVKSLGQRSALMAKFYDALSYRWFREDGQLDEEVFSKDLKLLGGFAADAPAPEEEDIYSHANLSISVFSWMSKSEAAAIGQLMEFWDLCMPYSAIQKLGKGSMQPFPAGQGVYVPGTVLGVNASGSHTEIAKQFVAYALSEDVLSNSFQDGFAVNRAALLASSVSPFDEQHSAAVSLARVASSADEEGEGDSGEVEEPQFSDAMILELVWPDDAMLQAFLAELETLHTPAHSDSVVKNIILDGTQEYLNGTQGLEEAVQGLREKLFLYLAE